MIKKMLHNVLISIMTISMITCGSITAFAESEAENSDPATQSVSAEELDEKTEKETLRAFGIDTEEIEPFVKAIFEALAEKNLVESAAENADASEGSDDKLPSDLKYWRYLLNAVAYIDIFESGIMSGNLDGVLQTFATENNIDLDDENLVTMTEIAKVIVEYCDDDSNIPFMFSQMESALLDSNNAEVIDGWLTKLHILFEKYAE